MRSRSGLHEACAALLAGVVVAACSGRVLSAKPAEGAAGGDDGPGTPGFQQGADAAAGSLAVSLSASATASCPGQCVELTPQIRGGIAPYMVRWSDRSTSGGGMREVCPTATTTYTAVVTDSSGNSGELPLPDLQAQASVTIAVTPGACAAQLAGEVDSGAAPGAVDAAQPAASSEACVGGFMNPSIAGTPQSKVGLTWDAPGWTQCPRTGLYPAYLANASTNPDNGVTYPAPSSGPTYAVFAVQGVVAMPGSDTSSVGFGQTLCTPLEAGASFRVDSRWIDPGINGSPDPAGTVVQLQIFEGATVCAGLLESLSTTIVPITQSWNTYCFTIPSVPGSVASITFNGVVNIPDGTPDPNATALILIDHVVPVASCP